MAVLSVVALIESINRMVTCAKQMFKLQASTLQSNMGKNQKGYDKYLMTQSFTTAQKEKGFHYHFIVGYRPQITV